MIVERSFYGARVCVSKQCENGTQQSQERNGAITVIIMHENSAMHWTGKSDRG